MIAARGKQLPAIIGVVVAVPLLALLRSAVANGEDLEETGTDAEGRRRCGPLRNNGDDDGGGEGTGEAEINQQYLALSLY